MTMDDHETKKKGAEKSNKNANQAKNRGGGSNFAINWFPGYSGPRWVRIFRSCMVLKLRHLDLIG